MRPISYLMMGIAGTIAYQQMKNERSMFSREMRRMMKNNPTMRKIREIF